MSARSSWATDLRWPEEDPDDLFQLEEHDNHEHDDHERDDEPRLVFLPRYSSGTLTGYSATRVPSTIAERIIDNEVLLHNLPASNPRFPSISSTAPIVSSSGPSQTYMVPVGAGGVQGHALWTPALPAGPSHEVSDQQFEQHANQPGLFWCPYFGCRHSHDRPTGQPFQQQAYRDQHFLVAHGLNINWGFWNTRHLVLFDEIIAQHDFDLGTENGLTERQRTLRTRDPFAYFRNLFGDRAKCFACRAMHVPGSFIHPDPMFVAFWSHRSFHNYLMLKLDQKYGTNFFNSSAPH
ncbi:hypothetical protein FKW77_007865 [Venturia effusa]|uniref:Uncharacterized protein n=1 Tax=Venturia effusa TaxID=50376 RepID=A0A517LLW9_9PEZI|nr:hypothetical protein FKW77_007865 [Venturia effusa]